MSSAQVAIGQPVESPRIEDLDRNQAWVWLDRVAPVQGWDTALFLMASLAVVVWSVLEADWVRTPGLALIVVSGAITGLLLSKVRVAPWPVLHLAGLAVGFLLVVWQGTTLIDDVSGIDRLAEMRSRLSVWYEAAATGGISTDLLPFSMTMLTLGWFLGYVSAWVLFRHSNVWIAVIVPATALLTNLSFLPEVYATRFFVFMFFAMLLVARVTSLQQHQKWLGARVRFIPDRARRTLGVTIAMSLIVLAITAALPIRILVSRTVADAWDFARTPVAALEDEFARLFSGIPKRTDASGRFWAKTLPFQGEISLEGETVLWATTDRPTYWLAQTYSEYSSKGWIAGDTKTVRIGPEDSPPPPQESMKRVQVNQGMQMTFKTSRLFAGGNPQWVSKQPKAEILQPKTFEIEIHESSGDAELPAAVQEIAGDLRQMLNPLRSQLVESDIASVLPRDLVFESMAASGSDGNITSVEKVTLARKEPLVSDVTSWGFVDTVAPDESYAMGSLVSDASYDDLRKAGINYSGFVEDHYLQLPASLPQRVRSLAHDLTKDAETPLDKAAALQDYLRGPTFEYSHEIDAPPRRSDGVDHFLFESKKGYSDYFGSAMAVMLRSVGVPARLAAGYAPGRVDETGRYAVLDSDSHGWTQVYFPGHGWMDFEPTSEWPVPQRGGASGSGSGDEEELASVGEQLGPDLSRAECMAPDDAVGDECLEDIFGPIIRELPEEFLDEPAQMIDRLPVVMAIVLAAIAAVWLAAQTIWTASLAGSSFVEKHYTKMSRLGAVAGHRRRAHQTPLEYASVLGRAVPSISPGARAIADTFAANRYGRHDVSDDDRDDLRQAWRSVRGRLLLRTLKRIVTLGSA